MSTILVIALLVLDILAIIHVAQSAAEPIKKALWIVGVLVFPLLGFLAWFFLGPRSKSGGIA